LSPVIAAAWIMENEAVLANPRGSRGELLVAPYICKNVRCSHFLKIIYSIAEPELLEKLNNAIIKVCK
jgi:hypothetical protein